MEHEEFIKVLKGYGFKDDGCGFMDSPDNHEGNVTWVCKQVMGGEYIVYGIYPLQDHKCYRPERILEVVRERYAPVDTIKVPVQQKEGFDTKPDTQEVIDTEVLPITRIERVGDSINIKLIIPKGVIYTLEVSRGE